MGMVVFHQKSSYIKCCLPTNVFFHQRSSSIKSHLPLNVVFHPRSSLINGCLLSNVVFHQTSSYINPTCEGGGRKSLSTKIFKSQNLGQFLRFGSNFLQVSSILS